MFVLVAYDIASTRRRNKVVGILSDYGERVNLSVFECAFKSEKMMVGVQSEVEAIIDAKQDHVRYYPICRSCLRKTFVQGCGTLDENHRIRFA